MLQILNTTRPKTSKVYDTYWKFAAERQKVFFRRLNGEPPLWTEDKIIQSYKFTNVYRACDRVSQYLIKNVIYCGDQSAAEVFFRTILFKLFNKIETWEYLLDQIGPISWNSYSFGEYDRALSAAMENGRSIYSAAYIMASGKSAFGFSYKHSNHLKLLEAMMLDGLPSKVSQSVSMEEVYQMLLQYPSIGSFLAYQYTIDLNYSNLTDFSEMEFVVAGPGALDGIQKCFTDYRDWSSSDLIKHMCYNQEVEFERLGIDFPYLDGRPLQLIDCQNLFCEVDKYARVAHPEVLGASGRSRIKQAFKAKLGKIEYYFPPKWDVTVSPRQLQ